MVSLAAVLLMVLAFAVVGYPLLRTPASGVASAGAEDGDREELRRERDSAYRAIRELDADYRLGHLSREDYEALRADYVDRAAGLLWRLDRAEAAASRGRRAPSPATCPSCGQRHRPKDRFCGRCGQRLEVTR